MNDIIIAGIGLYPVGEHWDISLRKMGARAVRAAIADSGGLQPQGLFVGNAFASILSHQSNLAALIADEAGLTGVEACAFEAAGASGGAAVRAAYLAVKSGFLDCAIPDACNAARDRKLCYFAASFEQKTFQAR